MAKLLVQESNGAREFELVDQELSIGRELDNSLRLADPSISRHHAVIRQTDAGHEIQDLGSSNGVLLNGHRVPTALLQDGDRITLGQLQLTYVNPAPAQIQLQDNPMGTVRMTLADMNKLQTSSQPESSLTSAGTGEIRVPPAPFIPTLPLPLPPRAAKPWPPPLAAVAAHPAPAGLRPYLPPVPDDAQTIMNGNAAERGAFGDRLLASLVDGLIGGALLLGFGLALAALAWVNKGLVLLVRLVLPVLCLGYWLFTLWCLVRFRASIGKKLMKLRVVPEGNPAGHIDWGTALLRGLGNLISAMAFFLPYLLILGARRKGLQDSISRSIVIKVDR